MAFRYINPGYVSLLDADSGASEITDTTYSRSGVAFYLKDNRYTKGLTIENFSFEKDFWMMFDFYFATGYSADICVYAPGGKKNGIRITNSYNDFVAVDVCCLEGYNERLADATGTNDTKLKLGINVNAVNTALLHVKFGEKGTGYIELSINNKKKWKYQEDKIDYTSENKKVVFYNWNLYSAVSNLIISDEEISPRERVISLPTLATETNMTFDASGIYIANAANQTLLQTPAVAEPAEKYGANSTVTGVAVVGNPAYKTGTGITTLTGLTRSGGVLAENDSFALSEETTGSAWSGWSLQNTTIADLQNMQFGWKAGE